VDSSEVQASRSPANGSQSNSVSSLKKFVGWMLRFASRCGVLALLAILIACFLAPYNYQCDLMSNFRAQYLGLGIGFGLMAVGLQQWQRSVFILFLTLPHALQVLPYYWPPNGLTTRLESRDVTLEDSASREPRLLRLVSFNVLYLNQDRADSIRFLRDSDADLIVLCECTDGWYEAVQQGLADTHPFDSTQLFPMWNGTRIFSRMPLRAATDLPHFREIHDSEKLLAVTTRWNDETIMVMGVHPASPMNAQRFIARNEMLSLIERVGTQIREPLIIAGDFNCTSGSPYFLQAAGLKDSRRGFGWQGSWPTFAPKILRIPIDHVFVNKHWEVRHREIGPTLGSDHSPVITELRLLRDAATTTTSP
jgi:endonuclease/exonuclease/phosphatase (EEP) superfamily protein YafD